MNLTETRPKHEFDRFPKEDLCHPFRGRGAAGNRPPGGSLGHQPCRSGRAVCFAAAAGTTEELRRLENSWQLCTIAGYDTVIRTALELRSNTPLSNAAMEVLAVVAYNQPVTRSFIEQVRGVDSSSVVASLEEKGLIEEAGRMELPGRPVAFRTTAAFLRCFGLSDLSELPELQPPEEAEETEEEEQLGFDDLTPEEEK